MSFIQPINLTNINYIIFVAEVTVDNFARVGFSKIQAENAKTFYNSATNFDSSILLQKGSDSRTILDVRDLTGEYFLCIGSTSNGTYNSYAYIYDIIIQ